MSKQKISIHDASDAQVLDYARNVLNLDVDGRSSRTTIMAKIAAVYDGDTIEVDAPKAAGKAEPEDAAPEDVETKRRRQQKARAARQLGDAGSAPMQMQGASDVPHYEIEVMKSSGPDGDAPVEVWVNGRLLVIPRAKRVEVPGPFLDVLQNAVQVEYVQSERLGDNGREIVNSSHETPRYNVRVWRGPWYPDAKAAA